MAERTRRNNNITNIAGIETINDSTKEAMQLIPEYLQRPELSQVTDNIIELVKDKGFSSSGAGEYADLYATAIDIAAEIAQRVEANGGGPVDLNLVIEKLRLELTYIVDAQMGGFNRLATLINDKLRANDSEKQPAKFTSTWVQRNSITTYRHIVRIYKNNSDEVDWPFIAQKLGATDIFEQNRKRDWASPETLSREIQQLEVAMEAERLSDPDSFVFNSETIRRHNSALHDAIGRLHRNAQTGNIDWESLVAKMSPAWQKVWSEEKARTEKNINDYLSMIREELEKSQPAHFGPSWIKKNCRLVYNHVIEHYRTASEEGKDEVDWQTFLQDLGGGWQERFGRAKKMSLEELVPKEQYENPDEIKQVEDRFEGSYYMASIMANPENLPQKATQNEIFERLIDLAQAGNKLAEQRILEHIQDLTAEWSENTRDEVRTRLQFIDSEELTRMYKECIYLYDQYRDRYPFMALVFGRLNRLLKQQNQFAFARAYDEPTGHDGEGRNYSEMIADPNAGKIEIEDD